MAYSLCLCCLADVDECAVDKGGCKDDPNWAGASVSGCTNTIGGYTCTCQGPYWKLGADNHTCEDVKECNSNHGGCPKAPLGSCTEVIGGEPICSCSAGYNLTLENNLQTCAGAQAGSISPVSRHASPCTYHRCSCQASPSICEFDPCVHS